MEIRTRHKKYFRSNDRSLKTNMKVIKDKQRNQQLTSFYFLWIHYSPVSFLFHCGRKIRVRIPSSYHYSLLLLISIQKDFRKRTASHNMTKKLKESPVDTKENHKRSELLQLPRSLPFLVILRQVITSGWITFHDQPWHKECFLCSGCRKELCDEEFMSRDDYPFCLDCYNHLYAKKCVACAKPITGEFFS